MPHAPAPFVYLIYTVFFVSGAAALIYQIAWVRSLSLVFGGSHLAVTTVVAVFMGGLALGSHLAARPVAAARNRLRTYAFLELGIAAGALLFQAAQSAFPPVYTALAGVAPESPAYLTLVRVALCVAILLPITTLMGATLPLLVDFCARQRALLGQRLSALYAVNTVGAVAGVILAGFVLLPATSVTSTVLLAFAANVLAAASAFYLSRDGQAEDGEEKGEAPQAEATGSDGYGRYILAGAAVSGFCALAYEVIWTRVLVLGLGATDYGFSAILAAFLVGIGLGSAVYNRLRARWRPGPASLRPLRALAGAHIAVGLLFAWSVARLYDLPAHYLDAKQVIEAWGLDRFTARQLASLAIAFIYLGLPALVMGAAFPLAGDLYGPYGRSPAAAVGRVASINTLGAILGAAAAGFALIPLAGIERALHLVVLVNLAYGAFLIWRTTRWPRGAWAAPWAAAALAGVLLANPGWLRAWDDSFFAVYRSNRPELFSSPEKIAQAINSYQVLYYGEGNSSIVAVTRSGPLKMFSTNGRVEATNALQDVQNQFALGHLPTLLHADPKKVLVVGGGAGMTLGATAVHPAVEEVTLAELEPKVLGAIDAFSELNHQVLASPKLRVVINDGRNHLLTTADRYDVITSDPIHPWFRGAGYLYTREYFSLAAQRLKPGGVMAQWLPLYQLNTDHIRSILASFGAAFRHVGVWLLYSDAVIVGSNEPLVFDLERIDGVMAASAPLAADLKMVNMGDSAENLLTYYVAGNSAVDQLTRGARLNTDDNLYLEFDAPRAIGVLTEADNVGMLAKVRESASPMLASTNAARIAAWQQLEETRTFARIDQVQFSGHTRQAHRPEIKALAFWLDNAETVSGRWKTVRSQIYPTPARH